MRINCALARENVPIEQHETPPNNHDVSQRPAFKHPVTLNMGNPNGHGKKESPWVRQESSWEYSPCCHNNRALLFRASSPFLNNHDSLIIGHPDRVPIRTVAGRCGREKRYDDFLEMKGDGMLVCVGGISN